MKEDKWVDWWSRPLTRGDVAMLTTAAVITYGLLSTLGKILGL